MSKHIAGVLYRKASAGTKGYVTTRCAECSYIYGWHAVNFETGKSATLHTPLAVQWAQDKGWKVTEYGILCPFCAQDPLGHAVKPEDTINIWNIEGFQRNPDYEQLAEQAAGSLFHSIRPKEAH